MLKHINENISPVQIIEYLRAVRDMTDDPKTLAYIEMAIVRQTLIQNGGRVYVKAH